MLFRPAIYKNGTVTELPRPVVTLRVQDAWDAERMKVPLADGETLTGHSRSGVEVVIEGRFGTRDGSVLVDEAAMISAAESLRTLLNVSEDADKYSFALYHDATTGADRHFRGCSTVRLETDLSDPHLFGYSLVIHADDPVMYETALGA